MTKKPLSGLAASGHADDPDPEQITKEHNEDGQDIDVDPSEDVTVEATEDVTTEAASRTPIPSLHPDAADGTPGPRPPTLLGVPIQSLPLPGVTSASLHGETTRTIDYDDEITVLAQAAPPTTAAAASSLDDLDDALGPSIVDDDEEETKVEPAESAMKAAESIDDVTTALSAQASLERDKALRRSVSAPAASNDLEFADPEAEDENAEEEEESLDDELSDEDEVISAGGAGAVEDDDDDDVHDGAPTATFMKPADSTGLSGLLNPRRPPTGNPFGRDGFGTRLPTPYSVAASAAASTAPAPSTSPFASRLGPAPSGSPYGARATGAAIPAIQVPPPSGAATTASEPSFLTQRVPVPAYGLIALVAGTFIAGFGLRAMTSKSAPPAPTTIVAKPTTAPAAPAAPVVEPVAGSVPAEPNAAAKTAAPVEAVKPPPVEVPGLAGTEADRSAAANPDLGLVKPAKKPAAPKVHRPAVDTAGEEAALKPAAASKPAPTPKPAIASTPKPAAATATPKPAAAAKPAKKPTKVWVDPFAQ
jgi:hypothetical protein